MNLRLRLLQVQRNTGNLVVFFSQLHAGQVQLVPGGAQAAARIQQGLLGRLETGLSDGDTVVTFEQFALGKFQLR